MTHEQFIELETAKFAKQAGFDWEINSYLSYYGNCPDNPHWAVSIQQEYKDWNNYKFKHIHEAYSAPTQSVLQRWLREIKNIHIQIMFDSSITVNKYYVIIKIKDVTKTKNIYYNFLMRDNHISYFDTFEDALEAGLKQCLTLLIEK